MLQRFDDTLFCARWPYGPPAVCLWPRDAHPCVTNHLYLLLFVCSCRRVCALYYSSSSSSSSSSSPSLSWMKWARLTERQVWSNEHGSALSHCNTTHHHRRRRRYHHQDHNHYHHRIHSWQHQDTAIPLIATIFSNRTTTINQIYHWHQHRPQP